MYYIWCGENTHNIPFISLHGQPTTHIWSRVPLVSSILPQGKYAVCYIWLFYHQIILTYWLLFRYIFQETSSDVHTLNAGGIPSTNRGRKTHNSPDHAVSWLFVSRSLSLCPSGVSVEEPPHRVTFNCFRVSIRGGDIWMGEIVMLNTLSYFLMKVTNRMKTTRVISLITFRE